MIAAYQAMQARVPELCLLVAPRDIKRAPDLVTAMRAAKGSRRTAGSTVSPRTTRWTTAAYSASDAWPAQGHSDTPSWAGAQGPDRVWRPGFAVQRRRGTADSMASANRRAADVDGRGPR